MQMKQRLELRKLLLPELRQSLKILALPLPDLKDLVQQELTDNPFLEESQANMTPSKVSSNSLSPAARGLEREAIKDQELDFRLNLITKKASLQDVLLRQLGIFTNTDEELKIGQEIIGNIDDNGYLKISIDEISHSLGVSVDKVENVLRIIQKFEPPGVAARSVAECLLIQLELANDNDPLTKKIIQYHLDDVAKKNFSYIARRLKEPLENIQSCVKKILRLDPKPGRNYAYEEAHNIIPDVIIDFGDEDEPQVYINNEDIPALNINRDYREMLKNADLNPPEKEYLKTKLRNALELLRAISKRQSTLRKVVEAILEVQYEAVSEDLSRLKPLTFKDIASKIGMHESTVCRVVMNKYAQTPQGIIALKDFFPSHLYNEDGQAISSNFAKRRIKELIDAEDKRHPLSDEDIAGVLLKETGLKVARRTVAKYREELKLPSSSFRKER